MYILYIGAGVDTSILKYYSGKTFVFVDSQPFSEYGNTVYTYTSYSISEKLDRHLKFMEKLTIQMQNVGFYKECDDINTSCIEFSNGNSKVYYFYSTVIHTCATLNTRLEDMIKKCNTLYICGHNPERDVINDMVQPITFIGNTDTCYYPDESDSPDSVLYNINKHKIHEWFAITETNIIPASYDFFFNDRQT